MWTQGPWLQTGRRLARAQAAPGRDFIPHGVRCEDRGLCVRSDLCSFPDNHTPSRLHSGESSSLPGGPGWQLESFPCSQRHDLAQTPDPPSQGSRHRGGGALAELTGIGEQLLIPRSLICGDTWVWSLETSQHLPLRLPGKGGELPEQRNQLLQLLRLRGTGVPWGSPLPYRVSRWRCPRSWHCREAESRPLMGTQRTRVQAQCREVEKDRAFWGPAHRPPPSPQSPRDPLAALPLKPQGLRAPPEHTSTWMDGSPATEQCPSSPWAHPALG